MGPGSAFLGGVSPAQDGGCWEPPFAELGSHCGARAGGHVRDEWEISKYTRVCCPGRMATEVMAP